ncbi:hypothetical protein ES705_49847 [subsurface metagenome]
MKFSHSIDNRLPGILIYIYLKSRILLCQFSQGNSNFIYIFLCFWFNGYSNNRIGKYHRFQVNWFIYITKRIPGLNIFKSNNGTDITGFYPVFGILFISVHFI